jgi:hypothetical protein
MNRVVRSPRRRGVNSGFLGAATLAVMLACTAMAPGAQAQRGGGGVPNKIDSVSPQGAYFIYSGANGVAWVAPNTSPTPPPASAYRPLYDQPPHAAKPTN